MRAFLAVLAACALAAGCGVGSEDEPQLIEESTQPPPAPPSFDTEQSPSTGSRAPTTVPGSSSAPAPTG